MMEFTCSRARITSRMQASWNAFERILNLQGEGGMWVGGGEDVKVAGARFTHLLASCVDVWRLTTSAP